MSHASTFKGPERAPVRRVVTGHTPEGTSIIVEDAPIEPHSLRGAPTLCTDVFWTEQSPPSNDIEFRDLVKDHPDEVFPSVGSSLKVVEMPPGAKSPFHRTVSLDYGILTHGQLTLIMDDDKRVVLKPGDVLVQRGTIHAFLNEGTEWTRLYCVVLPSMKVKVGDKELETEFRFK